jgi:hypothetical protein
MSGRSGPVRTNSSRKGTGRRGSFSPVADSVRQGLEPKPFEDGFVDQPPFPEEGIIESLLLQRPPPMPGTSWSKENPVYFRCTHPDSNLPTLLLSGELSGRTEQLRPYITLLNPISFADLNMTPPGVTSSQSGDTVRNPGTSSSLDSDSGIIHGRSLRRLLVLYRLFGNS